MQLMVHKEFSSIRGKLQDVSGYSCRRCGRQTEVLRWTSLNLGKGLDCVEKLCYLSNT